MAAKGMRARMKMWMIEYAYLLTAGALAAIVAASAMYAHRVRGRETVQAAAEAPETAVMLTTAAQTERPAITPLPTIAPLAVRPESFWMTGAAAWPVSGEIVRGYDPQEAVYWETLGCYMPHAALDIAGEPGEEVLAIADGVAEKTERDELWGCQVTIRQMDGRMLRYAGLESVLIADGQSVTRGQAIGVLMPAVPCEAELGAHLHIDMTKDGKAQDPEAILPEIR